MIDARDAIDRQLAATRTREVTLSDGSTTVMAPARYMPQLDEPSMRLSLNGTWKVAKWPFDAPEQELAARDCSDDGWPTLEQPGVVFFGDAEEDPTTVEGWSRLTLGHIDMDDGAVLRRRVDIPDRWAGKRIYLLYRIINISFYILIKRA